jgi:signal transduction histidine kinase
MSHLLFFTARPGMQALWTLLVMATLVYTLVHPAAEKNPTMVIVLVVSFAAVLAGIQFFPYDEYHPFGFFGLICAELVLISSLVYFTGSRTSLLGFLFLIIPVFAAHYYSYPGTMVVALATTFARFAPFMTGNISSVEALTLGLSAATYVIVGFIACYVVESEKIYGRNSFEFKRLLEISRGRESEVSLLCSLSRRFPHTLELDAALQITVALAVKALGCDGSVLFLSEGGEEVPRACMGTALRLDSISLDALGREQWFSKLVGGANVLEENAPLAWLDVPGDGSPDRGCIAAVPLFVGHDATGYLVCYTARKGAFGGFHIDVLSSLASQAAISIENARLYEDALDEKTKVETLLSAFRDGLVVTDCGGSVVQANPLAQRMIGFNSTDYGAGIDSLLEPAVLRVDLGAYSMRGALEAALLGMPVFGEMTIAGEAGGDFQASYIPLGDREGTVSGVALFLHDITEFKKLDQMRTNFVSNVSHELRTPLTSIVGFVSILLSGAAGRLTAQQEEHLQVVQKQAANLTDMIEDLLELSRLMARGEPLQGVEVDMTEVIEASMEQVGNQARDKGIRVELAIPDILPTVEGDAARLGQVVTNVLGNAIKFTDRGGEVKVVALCVESCVQVLVSDTGCGISPAYQPHIFDRFFRAHAGGAKNGGGFGLGLAISREIVELHGGSIWVESEQDRGSTFCFTVPVHEE